MIFLIFLALTVAIQPGPDSAEPVDSYARFPSAEICRANRDLAEKWKAAVFRQAWYLGYCNVDPACGVRWEQVGGPPAVAMRNEWAEADYLVRVWSLAVGVRAYETPEDYERDLRLLIGDRAFVLGVLPPPVPYWRVERAR